MNTNEVAKKLNVSKSTIQRWVAQVKLDIDKTPHGYYRFNEADVETLKLIQEQVNNGLPLQKVSVPPKSRKGVISIPSNQVLKRIEQIERKLASKADEVVSYQLLQHRSEMEEMRKLINQLQNRVETLEEKLMSKDGVDDAILAFREVAATEKAEKKKPFFKTLFSSN